MPVADTTFLDKALGDLESVRRWTPRSISKLEALIQSDDPWASYRVNPLAFAKERGLAEQEAVDLLLHATKLGIFEMEWRLLCGACSDTVDSFASITTLKSRCFCQLCHLDTVAQLDDLICVSFNLSKRVRQLPWHEPAKLPIMDFYYRFRFDKGARIPIPGEPRIVDMLQSMTRAAAWLEPGGHFNAELEVNAGQLAGYDNQTGQGFGITIQGAKMPGVQKVKAKRTATGWVSEPATIRPGCVALEVENAATTRGALIVVEPPAADKPPTLKFEPFLNGNRLLSNQTFRTLFRADTLAASEGVGVRDLTLLFTDLKGSTELYERVGDLKAFSLVQQHFEHLHRAVQEQEGAVVKTIGDAVMASFTRADQAVRAALGMYREIENFNRERGSRDLILKIGLHRGPSIAVTLNDRMDYFGQTVNMAARVQGLAEADQVCVTQEVMDAPGVREQLKSLKVVEEKARLRGIAEAVRAYRISLA